MGYSCSYQAMYQPLCGPTGPALRLIQGLILTLITNLVFPSRLVLYICIYSIWDLKGNQVLLVGSVNRITITEWIKAPFLV